MERELPGWAGRPAPEKHVMEGRFVRLEPLSAANHGEGLFAAASVPEDAARFRWLFEEPPESREAFQPWLDKAEASADPLFFTVIDKASGQVAGRQTLMRIDAANGVAEIGNILWGPIVARKPAATEALFLFASWVFDTLGYRRFEWKCNDANEPSKRAARRFGFTHEGTFRQHLVVKGKNRDTAWFSIIDGEWPALKQAYEAWLSPENFDAQGNQRARLEDLRARG
ncbi:MAG: GNAT family N-acetyltransferase [Mesorhizobium amorphae]|nr:MAG: GNAT family N-acetyltransferase [Mesorhizobium amorphae]